MALPPSRPPPPLLPVEDEEWGPTLIDPSDRLVTLGERLVEKVEDVVLVSGLDFMASSVRCWSDDDEEVAQVVEVVVAVATVEGGDDPPRRG